MIVVASSPAQHFFTAFGAGLAGFGLIFLLIGWIIRRTARSFRGPSERTQGQIVGFDTGTPGAMRVPGTRVSVTGWTGAPGGGPLYRPTVQFTTAEGTQVTATSPFGSNPDRGTWATPSPCSTTLGTRSASASTRGSAEGLAWKSRSCCSAARSPRSGS